MPTETDDPDLGHMHSGLESIRILSIWGNRQLTTSLIRSDTLDGEPESYVVELQNEDEILLNLTPAEAERLADHLYLLVSETRRAPAAQQSGSTD